MFKKLSIDIEQLPAHPALPDRLPVLFRYFAGQARGFLLLWLAFSAAASMLNALLPYYGGRIVDILSRSSDLRAAMAALHPVLAGLAIFCFVLPTLVGNAAEYMLLVQFMPRFGHLVQRQAHWHTLRQSVGFFHNDFAGRLAGKVQQMGTAVRDALGKLIGAVLYVCVFVISSSVVLASADLRLVIPVVIWMALYACLLRFFIPRIERESARLYEAQSLVTGRLVDSYTNIATVKLFARKDSEDRIVTNALRENAARLADKNGQSYGLQVCLSITNSIMIAATLLLGIDLWAHGRITPGQVAMVVPLILQINGQLYWIMWEMTAIFEAIGAARDSMRALARPHAIADTDDASSLVVTSGAVDFDNVAFTYGRQDGGLFQGLHLHIPAGQKVGLVGHSGAGKSTLATLLLRFHDVEGGCIRIDGQDIAGVTQDSLRAAIGMVTQDTSLLHRSVRENILYGRPDAFDEEMIAAARRAHAHDFILTLRDNAGRAGYDALVGERGVKLSGGQRQRIALARILLKDAPILILDEATSALDSEVEAYIQQHLAELMHGKTVIAIAHRLSTIARMDRLIVMEDGRIIEDGSHAELLQRNGADARLWALQSGGFLPD